MHSVDWHFMLIQILPSVENISLMETQYFQARSDPKESLLQWFVHLETIGCFEKGSFKKSGYRVPVPMNLFQLVMGVGLRSPGQVWNHWVSPTP